MRYANALATLLPLFIILLLMGTLTAGCGGGGGGGGGGGNGSSGGSAIGIQGRVIDTANGTSAGIQGWTVQFDGNYASSPTDSNGNFSLNVPSGAFTGADYLTVLDQNGAVQDVFDIDFSTIPGNPKVLPQPLTIGPPNIPTLLRRPGK